MLAQGLAALSVNQGYAGDYAQLFAGPHHRGGAGAASTWLPAQVQSGLTAGQLK